MVPHEVEGQRREENGTPDANQRRELDHSDRGGGGAELHTEHREEHHPQYDGGSGEPETGLGVALGGSTTILIHVDMVKNINVY